MRHQIQHRKAFFMKQYRQLGNKSVPYGLTIYFFIVVIYCTNDVARFLFLFTVVVIIYCYCAVHIALTVPVNSNSIKTIT